MARAAAFLIDIDESADFKFVGLQIRAVDHLSGDRNCVLYAILIYTTFLHLLCVINAQARVSIQ